MLRVVDSALLVGDIERPDLARLIRVSPDQPYDGRLHRMDLAVHVQVTPGRNRITKIAAQFLLQNLDSLFKLVSSSLFHLLS